MLYKIDSRDILGAESVAKFLVGQKERNISPDGRIKRHSSDVIERYTRGLRSRALI